MWTLVKAAERLGLNPATLRQQIRAGRLKAEKIGPVWVIDRAELGRYQLEQRGAVGRPFVGRPGYVDTNHVRVRLFLAPPDGRGSRAIWLQYLSQSFVLDLDLTNAKPFHPSRDTYEHIDLLTEPPPGGRTIRLLNGDELAIAIGARPDEIDLLLVADSTFPRAAVTFKDGPVWASDKVERWLATRTPVELERGLSGGHGGLRAEARS
jgi:hypothetical protein